MRHLLTKSTILLTIIIFLAAALRIWHVASDPPGLTWDEVAHGYNAYSLLTTGKDEYGTPFPLTLKSFGDYKPAGYTYLTIPFVALFGLTETAVRLPSVLFGIIAVFTAYFIVKRLFENKAIGLWSAGVLALSPWHIQFSRGGWEVNMALTLTLLGLLFFLKGLEKQKWFIISALFFISTLYTYQSSRLFVPLLLMVLAIIYRKAIFPLSKWGYAALFIGVILSIPFVLIITDSANRQRLVVQNLFSYTRDPKDLAQIGQEDNGASNSATFQLFHSQTGEWAKTIIDRESSYLSPSFLFITGDQNQRQRTPNVAHGYLVDIPFYLLGMYILASRKWKHKHLLYAWLLLAPIPAVLSRDYLTTLRSFQLVFGLSIVIALGLWFTFDQLRQKRWGIIVMLAIIIGYIANFAYYLDSYYVHMPKRSGQYWLTGYKPAIAAIKNIYQNYDQVVFTTDLNEPYIYTAFYLPITPSDMQKEAVLSPVRGLDVGEVERLGNFRFRHINWPADRTMPKTLFIGTEAELPLKDLENDPTVTLLKTIYYPNGAVAFRIVQTK